MHLLGQPDNHHLVGCLIYLQIELADDLIALLGIYKSLCVLRIDKGEPAAQVEVAVLRKKLTPLRQVLVAHLRLDYREDEVQVGVRHLVELVTGGALTAGIITTAVGAVEVTRIGDGQRQLPHSLGTVEDAGMRNEALLHRFDEVTLHILQSYDVAEIHQ